MRNSTLLSFLLAIAACCGCQSFVDSPYVKVKESGLNWISIRHYNYRTTPMQRVNLRIDGNGIVTVREGSSILVTNPFASSSSDPNWNDIRETRINIPREDVIPMFQLLVDNGLFERRSKKDSVFTNEAIFVSANIQNKTCGSEDDVFGSDPELAEHLKILVQTYYHPQPKSRR